MFADKDGCRCYDETTARCPVHTGAEDARAGEAPMFTPAEGCTCYSEPHAECRLHPPIAKVQWRTGFMARMHAGYTYCAKHGHWDPDNVGTCIHCGAGERMLVGPQVI